MQCALCKLYAYMKVEANAYTFRLKKIQKLSVEKKRGTLCSVQYTLLKKKKEITSYMRKFRWDRVQSLTVYDEELYMRKCADIF